MPASPGTNQIVSAEQLGYDDTDEREVSHFRYQY